MVPVLQFDPGTHMKPLSMVDLFVIFFIAILIFSFVNFRPDWHQGPRGPLGF